MHSRESAHMEGDLGQWHQRRQQRRERERMNKKKREAETTTRKCPRGCPYFPCPLTPCPLARVDEFGLGGPMAWLRKLARRQMALLGPGGLGQHLVARRVGELEFLEQYPPRRRQNHASHLPRRRQSHASWRPQCAAGLLHIIGLARDHRP